MAKSELDKAIEKIKRVEIQGAKNIAIFSLKFLKKYSKKEGFGREFDLAMKKLENARPTAVILHNCIKILKKDKSEETIDSILKKLENIPDALGWNAIRLLRKKKYRILTHCHSSEALAVIKALKDSGKKIEVIATETEPLEQGLKTVKDLKKWKMPVTLILDSAAGRFIPEVDCVIVGTDSIRKEGVINKIGTSLYAISAKYYKKPFYIVGDTLKFDTRKKFEIEERAPEEIFSGFRKKYNLTGIKVRNPAFDITPWEFITKIITEKDNYSPKEIMKILKKG